LGQANLMGFRFAKDVGGQELDITSHMIFAEELGRVPSGGIGMALTIHADMVLPMLTHMSPDSQQKILKPAIQGDILLAHAISEPSAGSDISAIQTYATKSKNGYIVSGTKKYVSLGDVADYFCVLAKIEERQFPFNMILLLIPSHADGINKSAKHEMLGVHTCSNIDISFENVFVPDKYRIGSEGMGFIIQMRQFVEERIISAARATASTMCQLKQTFEYASQRIIGDRPLIEKQVLAHQLAELKAQANVVRQLVHYSITEWEKNNKIDSLSAACKLRSSRLIRQASYQGLMIHGAKGYRDDSLCSRYYRDSRLYSISTGSDEMMLKTLSKVVSSNVDELLPNLTNGFEIENFREQIDSWLSSHILPFASDWERSGHYPYTHIMKTLGEVGLIEALLTDDNFLHSIAIQEALAENQLVSIGTSILSNVDTGVRLVNDYAQDSIKSQFLEDALQGNTIFSLAITESESGSSLENTQSVAVSSDADNWVLSGQKNYITNGSFSDVYCVLVRTESNHPMTSYTLFVVPRDSSTVAKPVNTMGNKGCLGHIKFKNTKIHNTQILGKTGQGLLITVRILAKERILVASRMYLIAKQVLKDSLDLTGSKKTFGSYLYDNQSIQFEIGEQLSELQGLHAYLKSALTALHKGDELGEISATAKLSASKCLRRVTDYYLQLAGGRGYEQSHFAATLFRDVPGLTLAGGTEQIMAEILARKPMNDII